MHSREALEFFKSNARRPQGTAVPRTPRSDALTVILNRFDPSAPQQTSRPSVPDRVEGSSFNLFTGVRHLARQVFYRRFAPSQDRRSV